MELNTFPWQSAAWAGLAALRGKVPHALLLFGARGIGKRQLAKAWAAAQLCESPLPDGHACGHCTGCQLLIADNHPDLRLVVPAADAAARSDESEPEAEPSGSAKPAKASREIRIDQVRDLDEFLSITSHRGGSRIVVLAPAEAMNLAAASSLLKMLEEPPEGALFVLVADDIDAVLPTVRSRCRLMRVAPPGARESLAWVEAQGVGDAAARLAEAGGAPLAAVESDDDRHGLDPAVKRGLLGLLARGAELGAADIASAIPRDIALTPAITLLQRWSWDLLACRSGTALRYYPGQAQTLMRIAQSTSAGALMGWAQELTLMRATSSHPLNARLAVERALLAYVQALAAQ
ncbi:MAG: DNA polymerase III subunit delta' [Burkholderiaceae bacterium]